jgi:hypothetical protein
MNGSYFPFSCPPTGDFSLSRQFNELLKGKNVHILILINRQNENHYSH